MTDLKIQHILTLSYLLSKGAQYNYVTASTSMIGRNIRKSQQAASKHLLELEQKKFIERIINGRNISIRITPKGFSEMIKLLSVLQKSVDSSPSTVDLKGTLVTGMGEGAYYMGLSGYTKQFKSEIGYVPFLGTLNVRLDQKIYHAAVKQLGAFPGIRIKGFSDGKRTYGWVKCFNARLNGTVDCQLIMLERTHHDDSIVELISRSCLRKAAKLMDGSKVSVKVQVI